MEPLKQIKQVEHTILQNSQPKQWNRAIPIPSTRHSTNHVVSRIKKDDGLFSYRYECELDGLKSSFHADVNVNLCCASWDASGTAMQCRSCIWDCKCLLGVWPRSILVPTLSQPAGEAGGGRRKLNPAVLWQCRRPSVVPQPPHSVHLFHSKLNIEN